MKIKLCDINSNPFKKDINKGKLNEETIKKIQSNVKELGLMGSLPVFKKENKYYLIAGHHRVEALKREVE
jgi:ParB-like chromosome segregation protein Spo0J